MRIFLTGDLLDMPSDAETLKARDVAVANGYVAYGLAKPGVGVWIMPMIFNHRVGIGSTTPNSMLDDAWCYDDFTQALQALNRWDPDIDWEPSGWKRHPMSGRRRPDGNKHLEYVEH